MVLRDLCGRTERVVVVDCWGKSAGESLRHALPNNHVSPGYQGVVWSGQSECRYRTAVKSSDIIPYRPRDRYSYRILTVVAQNR